MIRRVDATSGEERTTDRESNERGARTAESLGIEPLNLRREVHPTSTEGARTATAVAHYKPTPHLLPAVRSAKMGTTSHYCQPRLNTTRESLGE